MTVVTMSGPAYCIASDVDTDTVIKSRHCVSLQPEDLGPHCLAELAQDPPFQPGRYPVILCAGSFGIGSARIQAPIALQSAGVRAVLAAAFAPIFFENCLNGGYLLPLRAAIALPPTGTPVHARVEAGSLGLEYEEFRDAWPCTLPDWALAGRRWMDIIESEVRAAGGLGALRQAGLDLK